jgi:hypothetical protein
MEVRYYLEVPRPHWLDDYVFVNVLLVKDGKQYDMGRYEIHVTEDDFFDFFEADFEFLKEAE